MPPVPKPARQRQRHFLREWRLHAGLTQEAAADRLRINQGTLSKLERGISPYDQDFLEAAADAYGTTPESLIMRDPSKPDAIWSVHELMKTADPEKQNEIKSVIEVMLAKRAS